MSLFDHLVERALELARPVEPLFEASPLGPPPIGREIGPDPALATRAEPTSPAAAVAPARQAGSPAAPEGGTASDEAGLTHAPQRNEPRVVAHTPRETSLVEPRREQRVNAAVPASAIVHERSHVVIERRLERQLERTREIVHEPRTLVVERREIPTRPAHEPSTRAAGTAAREPSPPRPPTTEVPGILERMPAEPRRAPSTTPPLAPRRAVALPVLPAPRTRRPAAGPAPAVPARLHRHAAPAPAAPALRVEIGRVIVRAESSAPDRRARGASARPVPSLADYLARRTREER